MSCHAIGMLILLMWRLESIENFVNPKIKLLRNVILYSMFIMDYSFIKLKLLYIISLNKTYEIT